MSDSAELFLQYVRPHWRRLHAVAGGYLAQRDDARDLVQETLLRAWRAFAPTDDRTYARGWLFVIMRNVVIDWQRSLARKVRLVPVEWDELTEIAAADPCEPLASLPALDEERFRELLDQRLVAGLDSLEPVFREVLLLSVAGDLNYREIAEALDCPVGTVMSRMARARRALREHLADFARSDLRRKEVRQ